MKEVNLTQGFKAIVDDDDFEFISKFKWYPLKSYNKVYAWTVVDKKTVYMHREVLGSPTGLKIDHIDGNGLNNQKKNLRYSTHSQNLANRGTQKNNTTGYKGVCFRQYPGRDCFQASILVRKVRKHLGLFDTAEQAAIAYNKASKQFFGEFAYQNKVQAEQQAEEGGEE